MQKQRNYMMAMYRNRWHLVATFLVVLLPFLYLLWFVNFSHVSQESFLDAIWFSSLRLLVAYAISIVLGWVMAVLFYRGARAAVALPLFDVLQSFPTFAALPTAVLIWGKTNFTVVVFLVITIIWPIFFSIISALKRAGSEWHEVVEIAGLTPLQYLTKFLWPISVPGIITGSIIGLGEGWEALVATEIIVNVRSGLGNFFQQTTANPTVTAFGILGLLLFIFSLNKLIWLPLLERSHSRLEGT